MLMYAAVCGVRFVTENGHTMAGCPSSTSALMTTFYDEVAVLGILIVIFTRPAGDVSKTAVEQGSSILTLKFAVAVYPSTVAVRV